MTRERAVVVLEGWDTAGEGGIVRRLGWALDPRRFKVRPIAAPSSQEKGKHYLQRFWKKLPELTVAGFALGGKKLDGVYVGRRTGADLVYAGIGCQVIWQHA